MSRYVAIVAAMGVIGLAAAVPIYLAATRGEEEVVSQAEIVASSASPTMPAPTCAVFVKDVPCNPDAGMSDAERHALYQRLRSEGDRVYREWLASLDVDALDLRLLPRHEMGALYVLGESSLPEAVTKADVIVAGTVSEIRPTPFSGIDTVFEVERTVKGFVGATVLITQGGRLQQTRDGSGIEIIETANGPMLLPGDRAVLFLQRTEPAGESSAEYYIQSYSGWYQVVDGKIRTTFNEFGEYVEGKTEADFVELLTAAVNEAAAVSP